MVFNTLLIIYVVWLLILSVCILLLWRDNMKRGFSDAAKRVVDAPAKEYVVPGKRFFTSRKKIKATINDDMKAWREENKENS